jgi:hypothetical protein
MDNAKVTRTWGVAVAIIAAVVCIAAAALSVTGLARAQQSPASCCPAVAVQWQPGSVLETMFSARVAEDNKAVLNGLQAFAKNPDLSPADMRGYVGNTYLSTPRLWTKAGWVEGWDNVLPLLKKIITPASHISINTISVVIEYQPYMGAKDPADDIDARATIRMTFSASPGDNIMGGGLCHSRICEIVPCGRATG